MDAFTIGCLLKIAAADQDTGAAPDEGDATPYRPRYGRFRRPPRRYVRRPPTPRPPATRTPAKPAGPPVLGDRVAPDGTLIIGSDPKNPKVQAQSTEEVVPTYSNPEDEGKPIRLASMGADPATLGLSRFVNADTVANKDGYVNDRNGKPLYRAQDRRQALTNLLDFVRRKKFEQIKRAKAYRARKNYEGELRQLYEDKPSMWNPFNWGTGGDWEKRRDFLIRHAPAYVDTSRPVEMPREHEYITSADITPEAMRDGGYADFIARTVVGGDRNTDIEAYDAIKELVSSPEFLRSWRRRMNEGRRARSRLDYKLPTYLQNRADLRNRLEVLLAGL